MSYPVDCLGCTTGKHERHDPAHGITPGLIGGTSCDCSGDCIERAEAAAEAFSRAIFGADSETFPAPKETTHE